MAKGTSLTDSEGHVLSDTKDGFTVFAEGVTVPADGDTGYNPGCVFVHRAGPDNEVTYINVGSTTSAEFNPIAAEVVSSRFVFDSSSSIRIDSTMNVFGDTETILFDLKQTTPAAVADAAVLTGSVAFFIPIVIDGDTSTVKYIPLYYAD